MNVFDLIILAILAALTLRGIWKGMISQIVSVGSLFVCWIVASRFGGLVAPTVPVEAPWNQVLAMAVLFCITWIAIRFAQAALEKIIKHWQLAKLNTLLGGALGLAKGLLICLIITFFAVMVSETSRAVVFHSQSGCHLVRLITQIGVFVPKDSYEFLHIQLAQFQSKVDEAVPDHQPEVLLVQNSETMQQLLGQLQQTAEQTVMQTAGQSESKTGSLLTALSKWWNGTKEDSFEYPPVKNVVEDVAVKPAEKLVQPALTYTPPVRNIESPVRNEAESSGTSPPTAAVEEFFIRRPTPNLDTANGAVASQSLMPTQQDTPIPESLRIVPEPMELLPLRPMNPHVGSDLLLRNTLQSAFPDEPARVFRTW